MIDKKALTILKKYYLSYNAEGQQPSKEAVESAINAGILIPNSKMAHDEIVTKIKELSDRISLENVAKAFLYSLSSGDMRYRTALSSLVWAKRLPEHEFVSDGVPKSKWHTPLCIFCGCTHGLDTVDNIDWNEYNVFRYLPPVQYGRKPNFTCAEYVLNDLREFEKLPAVEPDDNDFHILNGIFAAVKLMKPHNMDTALATEIRREKILDATGNAIHCILGILSICGILESAEYKGFLHRFTQSGDIDDYRDGLNFYPLIYWRGRDGVNYDAVNEIFGSFCEDKLSIDKAVFDTVATSVNAKPSTKKAKSKAEQYFADGVYCIMLNDEERRYLALDGLKPEWEMVSSYSVTYRLKKRTVLFYEGNTIVKVIYEEHSFNEDGSYNWRSYREFDTHLETDNRTMLLPLTSRGRPKPVTPANVMAVMPFGCDLYICLQENKSYIHAGNKRNNQNIVLGENERVKKIMSDSDFHEFMQYYISTCPDDYFERIGTVRNMKHQTVKFKAGDIFRCQVDRQHYAYGIILGKTREIEKWEELPKEHSFRHLMTQPIIVRMYDFVTTNREMKAEELSGQSLRPPQICSDSDIFWGTHTIVAHKMLEPDDIQFQLQLARQMIKDEHSTPFTAEMLAKGSTQNSMFKMKTPTSLYVEWGFVSFEIPWDNVTKEIRQLLEDGVYYDGGVVLGIRADFCGKTLADIRKETPKHTIQYNLLLPENRDKFNLVMHFLGLSNDCTIDDFAAKYGGISRQRYIELIDTRSNK